MSSKIHIPSVVKTQISLKIPSLHSPSVGFGNLPSDGQGYNHDDRNGDENYQADHQPIGVDLSSKIFQFRLRSLQSGLSIVHVLVYGIELLNLSVQFQADLIGLLVHNCHVAHYSFEDVGAVILDPQAFLDEFGPVVVVDIFIAFFPPFEQFQLDPSVVFAVMHLGLQFGEFYFKLFILRLVRFHSCFIGCGIDGVTVGLHQILHPFELFLGLFDCFLLLRIGGQNFDAIELALEIGQLFPDIFWNLIVVRHPF